MSKNDAKEIKYYVFQPPITVVMKKGVLWYKRDRQNHQWIPSSVWMDRYYDAAYDVIEVSYDEKSETPYAPRAIPGFSSVTQAELIASIKNTKD